MEDLGKYYGFIIKFIPYKNLINLKLYINTDYTYYDVI